MFSIIIPTLNNLKYLKFCIHSILKNSKKENEILVHVSEDFDKSVRNYLLKIDIKFTYTKKNVGLCSAINIIAKKARFPYLIYSHDDMYFCPNWEKPLKDEIDKIKHNKFYYLDP